MRGGARTHQRPHLPPPARPVASGALSCAGVGLARGPSRIAPVKGRHPCSTPRPKLQVATAPAPARRRRAPDGSGRRARHPRHRRRGRDPRPGRRRRRLARPSARRRQPPDDDHVRRQSFPDYGLTADVVLALDSAKVGTAGRPPGHRRAAQRTCSTTPAAATRRALRRRVRQAARGRRRAERRRRPRSAAGRARTWWPGCARLECGTRASPDARRRQGPVLRHHRSSATSATPSRQSLALIGLERATRRGRLARRGDVPGRAAVRQRRLPGDVRRHALPGHGRRHRLRRAGAGDGRRPGGRAPRQPTPVAGSSGSSTATGRSPATAPATPTARRSPRRRSTAVGRDNAAAEARGVPARPAGRLRRQGRQPRPGPVRPRRHGRPGPGHQPGHPRAGAGHPGRHQQGRRRPRPAQAGLLARC